MNVKHKNNPDLSILPQIFSGFSDIMAVYLFGSTGTGRSHSESDLDLAILPADSTVHKNRLEILARLAEEGFCNVDLDIVYDVLHEGLDDIEEIKKKFAVYM